MSLPTITFVAVAMGFVFFCVVLYFYDLRKKVKEQDRIISQQREVMLRQSDGEIASERHKVVVTEKPTEKPVESANEKLNGLVNELSDENMIGTLDPDESLYVRASQYLFEEQPFTNPNLRMEDLCRALGTNRTTLGACIRKYSPGHLTTQQLVTRFRLRYAEKLLGDSLSDLNVAQVAEAAGFSSRSTFNRQFVQLYGCTPSDYRERSLSQTEGETPSNLLKTFEK